MGMRPLHRDPRHGQSRKPRHSPLPLFSQRDRRASLASLEHRAATGALAGPGQAADHVRSWRPAGPTVHPGGGCSGKGGEQWGGVASSRGNKQ